MASELDRIGVVNLSEVRMSQLINQIFLSPNTHKLKPSLSNSNPFRFRTSGLPSRLSHLPLVILLIEFFAQELNNPPLLLSHNTVMLTAREPLSTQGSHNYPTDTLACPARQTSKWDASGQMSYFHIVSSRHWQTALADTEFSTETEFNTLTK